MPNNLWIDKLSEAQDLLREAHDIISEYCEANNDDNAKAYLADHLRIMIDDDHGFLDGSLNIGNVIERLEEDGDDEAA